MTEVRSRRARASVLAGLVVTVLCASRGATGQELSEEAVTVFRPGAGYLSTDGISVIPLEIHFRDARGPVPIRRARVRAKQGKVTRTRVLGPGRVGFRYWAPKRPRGITESFSINLTLPDGETWQQTFPVPVSAPAERGLQITLDPSEFDAERPQAPLLSARANGKDFRRLQLFASDGKLETQSATRIIGGGLEMKASLQPPEALPQEAPSHFLVIGAASGLAGYAVSNAGISVVAPVKVRAEIERGSSLLLEGTETPVAPVPAPADGYTVVRGDARYGAKIRAFEIRGRRRREVPVVVPSGLVAFGLAVPLPGQNVADGGVGPSIVVAIPPSPFGDELIWPEIELEGANLTSSIDVGTGLRVLIVARPSRRTTTTVLADGVPIGTIEFGAGHGTGLQLNAEYPRVGERGAVLVSVTDPQGSPTDYPVPRAQLDGGDVLPVERTEVGRYRVSVPPTTRGATGELVTINVELEPPPVIAGDPPELPFASRQLELEGPPPAIRAEPENTPQPTPKATPKKDEDGPGVRVGLAVAAGAGATIGAQLVVGGALGVELRLPVWDHRVAFRGGLGYFRTGASGTLDFADDVQLPTSTQVAGMLIPIDIGIAVISNEAFELVLRGGLGLRLETGVLDVQNDRVGGKSRFGVGGVAAIESDISVGDKGAITITAGAGGIGTSAAGLSSGPAQLEGSLTEFRLDVGYRLWL